MASILEGRRERKKAEEDWTVRLAKTCADYEAQIKVGRKFVSVAVVDYLKSSQCEARSEPLETARRSL